MEAKDLRIGNLVNSHGGGDINFCEKGQPRHLSVITSLGDSIISWRSIDEPPNYTHSSIEPIPLTEEWLLKFGFVKDKLTNFDYYKDDFEIHLPNYFKYKDSILNKIKHVHQLQNLYHALTGKELKI